METRILKSAKSVHDQISLPPEFRNIFSLLLFNNKVVKYTNCTELALGHFNNIKQPKDVKAINVGKQCLFCNEL